MAEDFRESFGQTDLYAENLRNLTFDIKIAKYSLQIYRK